MAIRMTGMISGMDTESIVTQLIDAEKMKNKRTSDKSTLLDWKKDKWKELNTKLYKLYTDDVSKLRLQGSYGTKKVTTNNDNVATVTGNSAAPAGAHELTVTQLASTQYLTGNKVTAATDPTSATKLSALDAGAVGSVITIGSKSLTVDADTTIGKVVELARSAGYNANFDTAQDRFFIGAKESGASPAIAVSVTGSTALKDAMGLGTGSTLKAGQNSIISYNGLTIESATNTVSVNGLTINLKGTTAVGEKVTMNVVNDTKATYDMIKTFVKNYNAIVKEMNTLYDAPATRSFTPLSDDQKETMTDDQIEKWETKIKDSILRRDDTVSAIKDGMRSALYSSVKVDGKSYSLSSYGIQTSANYKENGILHILGDSEDAIYGASADKLKTALEEDPDTVMQVLSGVVTKLHETMTEKMSTIPNFRSALTFYNDKEMDKIQTKYKAQISDMEKKLKKMEDRYYKQFSAMETAMAKMQKQSDALAGMLGTN